MHTSIEAYVKIQMKKNSEELILPEELLDNLKRERPKLYQFFKPTMPQLAFFLISNCSKDDLALHGPYLSTILEAKKIQIAPSSKKAAEPDIDRSSIAEGVALGRKRDVKRKLNLSNGPSDSEEEVKEPGNK